MLRGAPNNFDAQTITHEQYNRKQLSRSRKQNKKSHTISSLPNLLTLLRLLLLQNMGKDGKSGGFLTPKAIANRIKAKGLQKLRWYCQMCQKQCRDEVSKVGTQEFRLRIRVIPFLLLQLEIMMRGRLD